MALRADGITRRDFVKITEGFQTQVPWDLHFGLGGTTTIDALEVRWPSGKVEVWKDLPVDQLLLVREGTSMVEARQLGRWSDGTRPSGIGSPSPTVEASRLDGGVAPLAGDRPAVINFWAPWCAPCNVELPQLVGLAERYGDEVDFVGVSVELTDLTSVREAIQEFRIPYPQFLADETVMRRFFGSRVETALPSTYVFDQDGRLRRLFRGAITEADLDALLLSFRDEGVFEANVSFLSELYLERGQTDAAIPQLRELLRLGPESASTHYNLGFALSLRGRFEEALAYFQEAIRIAPDHVEAHNNLGVMLEVLGRLEEARDHYRRVVELRPDHAKAHSSLGRILSVRGRMTEAISHFRQALDRDPDWPPALAGLAWIRAASWDGDLRDPDEAVRLAERAAAVTGHRDAAVLDALAAAYASAGRFDQAVAIARSGVDLADDEGVGALAAQMRQRLELYEQRQPYRAQRP